MKKLFKESININYKTSRGLLITKVIFMLIIAIVPTASAYVSKILLNKLVELFGSNLTIFETIVFKVFLIYICLQLFLLISKKILDYFTMLHDAKVNKKIDEMIQKKVSTLSLQQYEDTLVYDQIQNVRSEAGVLKSYFWLMIGMAQVIIQFVISVLAFKDINYVIPLIIILSVLPVFIVENIIQRKLHNWELSQIRVKRRMNYNHNVITNKEFYYDWKINNKEEFIFDKYKKEWYKYFIEKAKTYKKSTIILTIVSLIPNITYLVIAMYVIAQILIGKLTVGDFSFYLSIASQLIAAIIGLVNNINSFSVSKIKYQNVENFMNLMPNICNNGIIPIDNIATIEFKNVSFNYPGTLNEVIKDVNFTINKGEKVAIVGINGSGKTTLIKLLLHFYDLNSGNILINSNNIVDIDHLSYFKDISVIFQNQPIYQFSIKENLRYDETFDINEVNEIFASTSCFDYILNTEKKLDSNIGKEYYEDGIIFSKGEMQKISVLKLLLKKSSLKIIDEANSNLDIAAEKYLFDKLLNSQDTVIIVSHKLYNMYKMDKVIFINNSKVYVGSHKELLKNESYKNIYESYAERYDNNN